MNDPEIFVVEDDEHALFFMEKSLQSLRYNIAGKAKSGEDALETIPKCIPNLVLMDIRLEGKLDGIDTALMIKEKFDIPLIFMTAFSDDSSIERAKIAQPYGYLIKPFERKDLKSAIDIALYKKSIETKEKENDLWFKITLGSIADAVIATGPNNLIKFMNHAAEEICGYSLSESSGKIIDEVYSTTSDNSTEAFIYFLKEDPQNIVDNLSANKILKSKNGQSRQIEEKMSSILDEKGNILGKVFTFRDTTERRKTELAVLAAKDFYLNILENFPVLIWRANKEKQFNYFNSNWTEFTGRNIESQIYQGWLSLIHNEDKQKFISVYSDSFELKEKFEVEFRLLAKDYKYHWLICFASPIYDLQNNFEGYIGVCLDYTNRKLIEDEYKKAKEISDSANSAKTNFINNMSHEFRTPLNGIMGLTELLLQSKLDTDQLEYLSLIKEVSNSLLVLINNLLGLSSMVDKKAIIEQNKFRLRSLIKEITEPVYPIVKRNGVEILIEIDDDIPDSLEGDDTKIMQVLTNLLSNSVKFTHKGKILIKITKEDIITNDINKLFIKFSVSDTGIGIPKEMQGIIFETFSQVDASSTRKYSGCGLGLAVAKSIVELLNGKIWFESDFGKGSNFHFMLGLKRSKIPIPSNQYLN